MPKIHGLPPLIDTLDATDVFPIDDASVADPTSPEKTKRVTFTQLREWLQTVPTWITKAMIGANQVDSSKIDWTAATGKVWWEEIGRATASGTVASLSLASLPAKKYLMIIATVQATGGATLAQMRFNNDAGNNYSRTYSITFGAAVSSANEPQLTGSSSVNSGQMAVSLMTVTNIANREKLVYAEATDTSASGAGTSAAGRSTFAKWANTTAQITRVDLINPSGTGSFAAGSELVVLGHD